MFSEKRSLAGQVRLPQGLSDGPRFGKALRQKRHRLGVSQEEFADFCALDRSYVGGIERGARNVALVNLEKLAKAVKISLSELLRSV